jgi:hypothetical protein
MKAFLSRITRMGEFYEYFVVKILDFIRAIRAFVSFAIVFLSVATSTPQAAFLE